MTRTLPHGACIRHAINSVRSNIGYAFRISWPWYVVVFAINLAVVIISNRWIADPEANFGLSFVLQLIVLLANMVSFASVAVNWHRYILLDQIPAGNEILRLDALTWRYLGNLVLISLILFAGGFLGMVLLQVLAGLSAVTGILAILLLLVGLAFAAISFYRLSVKLPAVALGRQDFSLRDAWTVTRDNKQPLFLIALFVLVVAMAAFIAVGFLFYMLLAINVMVAVTIALAIVTVLSWLLSIFGITILTSLYGFFVEGRDF